MKSAYDYLIELLTTQPQTSTFAGSGYPTYSNQPVKLPIIKQAGKAVKDYGVAQKDYVLSKQFPTDVISQNIGIGLGAAAGTPFGLTGPGAIAGGALGGFVGNRIKEQQGYPQTAWSTLLDTITGGIPGNLDNVASARFGLLPKSTPPNKPFNIDPSHILSKHPDLNLKKDIPITDIHGNKAIIPQGEALSVYELKGGKVLLKDGEEYIVNKNHYANVKGNSIKGEAVDFAPELKHLEEKIRGISKTYTELPQGWKVQEKSFDDPMGRYHVIDENGNPMSNGDTPSEAIEHTLNYLTSKADVPTKFSQYQLPGGKNYKEILLKAPANKLPEGFQVKANKIPGELDVRRMADGTGFEVFNRETNNALAASTSEDRAYEILQDISQNTRQPGFSIEGPDGARYASGVTEQRAIDQYHKSHSNSFRSSHYPDDANLLAHLRMNQREYQGKPVSFLEELQSDWASKGRREGFRPDEPLSYTIQERPLNDPRMQSSWSVIDNRGNEIVRGGTREYAEEQAARYNQAGLPSHLSDRSGIPNHPLLKQWPELSLKRALQESVNNNSDYFAWTTGEQQAGRYNLSKQVDKIQWDPSLSPGGRTVDITPKGSNPIKVIIGADGKVATAGGNIPEHWLGKGLDEVVGKGVADNILKNPQGKLSGEGLNIGGEWAKNLYDNQVKSTVEKLTGGMVEPLDLGLPIDSKNKLQWFVEPQLSDEAINKLSLSEISNLYRDNYPLTQEQLQPGLKIREAGGPTHVITEALDNGKFRAIPSQNWKTYKPAYQQQYLQDIQNWRQARTGGIVRDPFEAEFTLSNPLTTQQGLHLTPEIKSKIKGEMPFGFKSPSNSFPNAFSAIPRDVQSTHPVLKMLGF